MLVPSIFGETFFDNFFDDSFRNSYRAEDFMHTDVQDTEQGFLMTMDIPGVKKEDVKAELKDGYLTIQAVSRSDSGEQESQGGYIRRERYYGSSSRSFYVGEHVRQEDIKAKFEDGTLKMLIPKKEKKVEEKKYIEIEG